MGLNQGAALASDDVAFDEFVDRARPKELELDDLRERQSRIAADECHVVLSDVRYEYSIKKKRFALLTGVSMGVPRGRKIALLGHKRSGKSTFLELLGQKVAPTKGRVMANSSVSWPLNLTPFFVPMLTVRDNLVFAARVILSRSPRYVLERAVYFAELNGDELDRPLASMSDQTRRRLGLAIGLMGQFDLQLFDGVMRGQNFGFEGDAAHRFRDLVFRGDYLISLVNPKAIPPNCDLLYVLYQGQVYMFEDISLGVETFEALPPPSEAEVEKARADRDANSMGLEAF